MNPHSTAQLLQVEESVRANAERSQPSWPWTRENRTGPWLSFELDADATPTTLGCPGLWKIAHRPDGQFDVFDVPTWITDATDDGFGDGEGRATMERFRLWAKETAGGRVPHDWHAPAPEIATGWLPENALTLHQPGILRQGRMVLENDCWTLVMPILPVWSSDVPDSRRRALEEVLADAQSRWAMVRFGFRELEGKEAVDCEVNLTGAPHHEPLLLAAVDAIRNASASVVEVAECLSDLRVEIRGLGALLDNKPNERSTQ